MIIFIYGKDVYRLQQKLKEIIDEYRDIHKSGLNLRFLEKDESVKDLLDCNKQVSMFDEKRLFILSDVFNNTVFKEDVIKNIENLLSSENIFVIYGEGEVRKNDKLLTLLKKEKDKKRVIIKDYPFLPEKKLYLWIEAEFLKNNVNADKNAIFKLQEMCGSDTWRLKNEVEKLSCYKNKIKEEDVNLLVSGDVNTDIFKTIDAMAEKDVKKAFIFFYNHLKKQESPHYLLSMIVYQFRNLFTVKDLIERGLSYNEAKTESGINPYVFKKTYYQAQNFSKKELSDIYNRLFDIDLKIKTGQVDPVLALHNFLFKALV